mmetsp:Transcript_16614/g.26337  ORF Transcript_16614/g.26337 Transcript_16614/m.26337 type:complete len:237 (-) Transcript_16614:942-1652(-)
MLTNGCAIYFLTPVVDFDVDVEKFPENSQLDMPSPLIRLSHLLKIVVKPSLHEVRERCFLGLQVIEALSTDVHMLLLIAVNLVSKCSKKAVTVCCHVDHLEAILEHFDTETLLSRLNIPLLLCFYDCRTQSPELVGMFFNAEPLIPLAAPIHVVHENLLSPDTFNRCGLPLSDCVQDLYDLPNPPLAVVRTGLCGPGFLSLRFQIRCHCLDLGRGSVHKELHGNPSNCVSNPEMRL